MSHKSVLVSTRFTQAELGQIGAHAKLLGLKLSTFIRAALYLYIENNPEIPSKDVKTVYGIDSDPNVVKGPTSFRTDEKQQLTLSEYLTLTRAKKSSLVRHAAVLACGESVESLQSRPEFCAVPLYRGPISSPTERREHAVSSRLEGSAFNLLNKRAREKGLSRCQFIEQAILAALKQS